MKKFISKPAALIKYMLLAVLAVSFIACGYDDVNEEKAKVAAEYYALDGVAGSGLIEADVLKRYIDAGYVTPEGQKVLILFASDATATINNVGKSIAGAYPFPVNELLFGSRSDGPVVDGAMVVDGAGMDKVIREYGIDANTLIVLTGSEYTSAGNGQMVARAFWTFKYWGFSNKQVKVLNGLDKYFQIYLRDNFATEFDKYYTTFRYGMPQPSTFSVKDLPGQQMDSYRAPIGEVLGYVAAGALKADGTGSAVVVSTMNAAFSVSQLGSDVTETYVIGNSRYIEGRINGATQLALKANTSGIGYVNGWDQYIDSVTGKFLSAEQITELMQGLANDTTERLPFLQNVDKNKRMMFHCITGRTTAPHWFVAREILGYTNAAIYDGSWQEWTNLAGYVPSNVTDTFVNQMSSEGSVTVSADDYLAYNGSEFVTTNGAKANIDHSAAMRNLNWDTARYTKFLTMSAPKANSNTYDNEYAGDGREINTADKNYQAGKGDASSGGNSGGASSGGGSAPAGC